MMKRTRKAIKIGLIGLLAASLFSTTSCKKKEVTPLNEQYQYDLTNKTKVTELDLSDFTNPGISISDFDGDGRKDIAVSNKINANIHIAYAQEDGTFENFTTTYKTANVNVFDVAAEMNNGTINTFVMESPSCEVFSGRATPSMNNVSSTAIAILDEYGQIGSDDYNSDGVMDLFTAKGKVSENTGKIPVYQYITKTHPDGTFTGTYDYDKIPLFGIPSTSESFDLTDNVVYTLEENGTVYSYDLTKHTESYE